MTAMQTPWIVMQDIASPTLNDRARITRVMLAEQRPDEAVGLRATDELLRAEVFPADRLERVRPDVRDRYASAMAAYLRFRRDVLNVPDDGDTAIDLRVQSWVGDGYRTATND